jgi:hypothetical protein
MGVDSPVADLARLIAESVGTDQAARVTALEAYTLIRPVSEMDYELLDAFRAAGAWLGPARWVRWKYLDDRSFDDPNAVLHGLTKGLARLEEFQQLTS